MAVSTNPAATGVSTGSGSGGGGGGGSANLTLLSNVSSTGAGSTMSWPGGKGTFNVVGTFGGTSAILQFLGADGTTWIAAGTDTTLSAGGAGNFDLPAVSIRANLSGGSPSGIYANASTTGN